MGQYGYRYRYFMVLVLALVKLHYGVIQHVGMVLCGKNHAQYIAIHHVTRGWSSARNCAAVHGSCSFPPVTILRPSLATW